MPPPSPSSPDSSSDADGSRTSVLVALAGNVLVAATKTVAAVVTGSSAMLSEALHSLVDTGNELLLLYGMRTARKRADRDHPAGYGRELYFWSFIVALLVFSLGAGISVFQGVRRIVHPAEIESPMVSEVVLGLSFLFEGWSWVVSWRKFGAAKGDLGWYEAIVQSKNPPLFMVLLEDSAALVGILIAAGGTWLSASAGWLRADGAASVLIGLVLAGVSILLARESKSLLIGEPADAEFKESLLRIANEACQAGRAHANGAITLQLAPDQVMAAISLEFDDSMRAPEIERLVATIEQRIRAAHPEVVSLFVKPQSPQQFEEAVQERYGDDAQPLIRDGADALH